MITCDSLNYILESKSEITQKYNVAFKAIGNYSIKDKILEEAPKTPNGYKFELFIFQAFSLVSEEKFGLLEINRDEEFAPIKNLDEKKVDCSFTAR